MAKIEFDRKYGVASILHNPDVYPFSPVIGDVERVVSYDEDKKEVVSYVPVDYKKIVETRGFVEDWSLDALTKAGINPNFGIHTGSANSRVEGIAVVEEVGQEVEKIINESNKTE